VRRRASLPPVSRAGAQAVGEDNSFAVDAPSGNPALLVEATLFDFVICAQELDA
jgi:hypothetical protein